MSRKSAVEPAPFYSPRNFAAFQREAEGQNCHACGQPHDQHADWCQVARAEGAEEMSAMQRAVEGFAL